MKKENRSNMTANKAPEKIYLQIDPDEWIGGTTWCEDRINDSDIEYIRADQHCTCSGCRGGN